ncbi:MAG: SPFH domain-containing protein, partial [Cyanobacteria bacterium P01_H01_bin.121]
MGIIIAAIVLIVFYIFGSARIINEGDVALVERFGKYRRTLKSGLNFIFPFVDNLILDTTREQVYDVEPQEAFTADNVFLKADAVVFWKITDLYKVHYEIEDIKKS